MRSHPIPRPLLAAVFVCLLLPASALAYLDPGTGSFIIQMLIGAVLGGLVAVGVFWRRVLGFFKRLFGRGTQDDGKPRAG